MNSEASRVLSQFSDYAYCIKQLKKFEAAAQSIYGQEWNIVIDIQNRMQFLCTACNKEMNSVNAMDDHNRSGNHVKMISKNMRHRPHHMSSLQEMLQTSNFRAVGLQNVEEFKESAGGLSYFKCNLCGSHSKMDAMYNHLIGVRHTENYIKLKFDLLSYLSSADREKYTRILLDHEGSRIEDMRTIIGHEYFPYRWKNDVNPSHRVFEDRTTKQIQPLDDGGYRGRNIGAVRAFSRALKETYAPRNDKFKKSTVDCSRLYSSCASLNSTDVVFEEIMFDEDGTLKELMDQIYIEEKKEKVTSINPIKHEEDKKGALKLLYILSVEEFEKTNANITQCTDPTQKISLESHLKHSSKVLGILQSKFSK